jgi:hypothetical protein
MTDTLINTDSGSNSKNGMQTPRRRSRPRSTIWLPCAAARFCWLSLTRADTPATYCVLTAHRVGRRSVQNPKRPSFHI